jgi:DNA-directed RNA polymerase omega subunit
MTEKMPVGVDSKFRYVLLVAKRAEQLIQGAVPRVTTKHTKPTRIAMSEVQADKVNWEIPTLPE